MQNSPKSHLALYQQRLNLQNAAFTRIEHEDAMIAMVYKITQSGKANLILKICPREEDYRREIYFLERLADALPVAHIVGVVPPDEGVDGAILMECLPGELLKINDYTDELAFDVGSLLGKIHLNRVGGYGDLTLPDHLGRDPCVYFGLKFEEELAECGGHLPNELIEMCRRYYDLHIHLLDGVDGPCIVHRDFRPGNLIIYQGRVQGIIDWAGGRGGFAEQDFCCMEHSEWHLHSKSKKSFLAGYASVRPVPDYSAIMPLLRLGKALGVVGFTVKQGTWKGKDARVYKFNRTFLETVLLRE